MQQITPCRWCNDQAEEAARFSTSIFTNATIGAITHDGEGSPRPKGSVLTVRFQLDGQEFLALNGVPQFTFTEAVSFIVNCETQEELDRMWKELSAGGHADEEARHPRAGGGIRASLEACVYPDEAIGGHGGRRTRKVCRAQQSPITRSRIPSFRRRIRSVTGRPRLTMLCTCSMRRRRWCSV